MTRAVIEPVVTPGVAVTPARVRDACNVLRGGG
jgi:hypothetical protein